MTRLETSSFEKGRIEANCGEQKSMSRKIDTAPHAQDRHPLGTPRSKRRDTPRAMSRLSRRTLLGSLGLGAAGALLARPASATLVRGMPLEELVGRSQHAVLGTPLDARCLQSTIGGRSMIVTETRVRIDGALGLTAPGESELRVLRLGGQLAGRGELVHGQADLHFGQLCALFLERSPDGTCWVTGMAQGHYPLARTDAAFVLNASPQLPTIRDWEQSAVKRLVGTRLSEAERLVASVRSR